MEKTNHDKLWDLMDREQSISKESLEKAFAHHLEYTVGKHRNNTNKQDIYEALSFTVRDVIVDRLNETQHNYRIKNPKRVYYLSLEFLIGISQLSSGIEANSTLNRSYDDSIGPEFDIKTIHPFNVFVMELLITVSSDLFHDS